MAKVAIRADGGKNVGMGHLMRCLSLARAFLRQGHEVLFFSKYDMGIAYLLNEGFSVFPITSYSKDGTDDSSGMDEALINEAQEMRALLQQHSVDILIIDSYKVSKAYFLTLKQFVSRLVYIDDENKYTFPVDVVINGNLTAEYLGYQTAFDQQRLLLGTGYNMLREEFRNVPPNNIRDKVEQIMITTGGSDPYRITEFLLNSCLKKGCFPGVIFNILVGNGFENQKALIQLSQEYDQVVLYTTSLQSVSALIQHTTMLEIMLQADMAIAAGGSTLYELTACGTPTLAFIMAKNQEFLVDKMSELGYIENLGWHSQWNGEDVVTKVDRLMKDYTGRVVMSNKGRNLVDGLGTERIVTALVAI